MEPVSRKKSDSPQDAPNMEADLGVTLQLSLDLSALHQSEVQGGAQTPSSVAGNPFYAEYVRVTAGATYVSITSFAAVYDRFGMTLLSPEALDACVRVSKAKGLGIVSMFAGLGYAEEQLRERGCDVVAFDRVASVKRWFSDLQLGSPEKLLIHGQRALFMGFPDRGEAPLKALEAYLAGGGTTVMVTSEKRGSRHAFGADEPFFSKLATGKLLDQIDLPRWPELETLRVMRFGHATFEPELKVYEFASNRRHDN